MFLVRKLRKDALGRKLPASRMEDKEWLLDVVLCEELCGDARILAGDEIALLQCFKRPERHISEIAYRRRNDRKSSHLVTLSHLVLLCDLEHPIDLEDCGCRHRVHEGFRHHFLERQEDAILPFLNLYPGFKVSIDRFDIDVEE